ncbi:hypothetical protein [Clostridium perfringens]|uniref:hypothetical protein n=1 Tax=Clostridium perfringens TaxID=1502 RepID=UPI0024BD17E5|nr:hypothetical protein [Clostridium perfringens]
MSKYEKALDKVLEEQYDTCDFITDCTECCVFFECAMSFGRYDENKNPTKEEFVKKIKEELLLYLEE